MPGRRSTRVESVAAGSAPKLSDHVALQRFGLLRRHAVDLPNDLVLAGRGVDNEVRLGHCLARANGSERAIAVMVNVEINVADGHNISLGSSRTFVQAVLGRWQSAAQKDLV
jgi:hypothetical protein